jgi:phosphomevalonate kinase
MNVCTSAPGKVIVSGEYAVLDGAPAVVMALDRRARVSVSAGSGDWHRVSAPGLFEGKIEFSFDDAGEMSRLGAGKSRVPFIDLSLVEHVLKAVGVREAGPLELELDTRPFFDEKTGLKLGFGSSAALAVALTSALMPGGQSADIGRTALAAHRAWQGGGGSGVDIAAAVHGGIVACRAMSVSMVEPLLWPDGLRFALLWSGHAAVTRNRIVAFRESERRRGGAEDLCRAAEEALATWRQGDGTAILEGLARYVQVLLAFDVDRNLGIFDAGHRALTEAAGNAVVYKPCGAGGGDVGIALALKEGDLDEFVEMAQSLGFERLDVLPDARGVE